ncbi:MAG TPA: M28 family peptidase [Myxococcales bacterium]|nr:M28 family peptidase [Myxococcales bacterium]
MPGLLLAAASPEARAQKLPLPDKDVAALAQELSGETAMRNLEGIARFHRQRGSEGFRSAAGLVAERARAYGLSEVAILEFPADGKIFYGTQRSRPAWDAESAELWDLGRGRKLASFEAEPVALAEDSESADVTASLVDVGHGTREADYAGKEVKGRLVLTSSQPAAVQELAVGKLGAAGIVSFAQNQKTAWWGEDENLVRWGHLDSFSPHRTFAFMISLKTARALRERLGRGEEIRLHATVRAGRHPGKYSIVTAAIAGADPRLADEEIAFSCHLDHQRPGANDNASGCAAILEAGRALQKLIGEGKLARPARTLRFFWPPEIEGTTTLLNARPDLAARVKAVVHMDMVGGGAATKAVFHVTRGPSSLPSFIHDVAWAFAAFVNEQSYRYAATGSAGQPLVAPSGGKEPLLAQDSPFTGGSDHVVYQDSSFRIPAIYLNDWPDRYIHTNFDGAANIDPTKLLRAAFIGAASAYALASTGRRDWTSPPPADGPPGAGPLALAYRRRPQPKGPMTVFGYDWFADHARAAKVPTPKLLEEGSIPDAPRPPQTGGAEDYAYEILNFADGSRTVQQIRDAVSAEYGPIDADLVAGYLRALAAIGVLEPAN